VTDDKIGLLFDELAREALDFVGVARAPAIVDPNIAASVPAQILQRLSKCRHKRLLRWIALGDSHQHAHSAHPLWLLRTCLQRPSRRYAADKPDKLAPLHCPPRPILEV
jgi:hypothetical protein